MYHRKALYCIVVILTVLLSVSSILSLFKRHHIRRIDGSGIIDNIIKGMMNKMKVETGSKMKYKDYINIGLMNELVRKNITLPDELKPDGIQRVKIDGVEYIIMIECDEGFDFHSDTLNIKYISKWILYNHLLVDESKNRIMFRITYPNKLTRDTINEEVINNIISHVLNFIYIYAPLLVGCYILIKYNPKNDRHIAFRVDRDIIMENVEASPEQLYKNVEMKIKTERNEKGAIISQSFTNAIIDFDEHGNINSGYEKEDLNKIKIEKEKYDSFSGGCFDELSSEDEYTYTEDELNMTSDEAEKLDRYSDRVNKLKRILYERERIERLKYVKVVKIMPY